MAAYPPHGQAWRHTQNDHFSKMTRLPVRFQNCHFLLFRPVNKYEVNVHESVGLQERVSVCTCFSLCPLSASTSLSFPCPNVTFREATKKKIAKKWDSFCALCSEWGRLFRRKWGKNCPNGAVCPSYCVESRSGLGTHSVLTV